MDVFPALQTAEWESDEDGLMLNIVTGAGDLTARTWVHRDGRVTWTVDAEEEVWTGETTSVVQAQLASTTVILAWVTEVLNDRMRD